MASIYIAARQSGKTITELKGQTTFLDVLKIRDFFFLMERILIPITHLFYDLVKLSMKKMFEAALIGSVLAVAKTLDNEQKLFFLFQGTHPDDIS